MYRLEGLVGKELTEKSINESWTVQLQSRAQTPPSTRRRVWHTSSHFLFLLTQQFRILDYQSDYRHIIFHVTKLSYFYAILHNTVLYIIIHVMIKLILSIVWHR